MIKVTILILSTLNNKWPPARVLQLGRSSGGGDDFDDHGVLKQWIGWCDDDGLDWYGFDGSVDDKDKDMMREKRMFSLKVLIGSLKAPNAKLVGIVGLLQADWNNTTLNWFHDGDDQEREILIIYQQLSVNGTTAAEKWLSLRTHSEKSPCRETCQACDG